MVEVFQLHLLGHAVRSLQQIPNYSSLTRIPISPKSEGIVLLTISSPNAIWLVSQNAFILYRRHFPRYLSFDKELIVGLEPTAYRLQGDCSTIELYQHKQMTGIEPASIDWKSIILAVVLHLQSIYLKRVAGLEPVYPAWKAGALAIELYPHKQVMGIEPTLQPWQGCVLAVIRHLQMLIIYL